MGLKRINLGILAGIALCVGAASAQNTSQADQHFESLIELLDDESWIVREQATATLSNPGEGFTLDRLADVLARDDLSTETRTRVQIAARDLFGQTTKAGLGVGFGAARDGGVEIGTVVEEVDQFPAAKMLAPGDLIMSADGHALRDSNELRALILSHEPGESLNVLVERVGKVLDLDLPLGSFAYLRGAAPITPSVADRALEIRWARQGKRVPSTDAVGGSIDVEDWIAAGYPEGSKWSDGQKKDRPRWGSAMIESGSSREVYVGVGAVQPTRIEAWSGRDNAQEAMDQARRIELSQQMHITQTRVTLLKNGVEMLKQQAKLNPADQSIQSKIEKAMGELRAAQDELRAQTAEFDALNPIEINTP